VVHWTTLKTLWLAGVAIHYAELSDHINELSPGTHIVLEDVYLLSEFWADLVDVLREKADCNSTVTCLAGNNDGEGDFFSDIVEQWEDEENPASAYITRKCSDNPLRSLPVPHSTISDDTIQENTDIEGSGEEE